ncbi:NAD(P)-binding domain-containing protein, partial [candidate division KSB1 bacterium]|nr:NAD(P)-binding domain-containing protein [candidate division KSB1 bacterium]NIR69804.1 NAD(P)-binding domain-containing protein [candidate division KSB1 bacterium]NIS25794.1 NAD(P)-binding domain-containing protein [candidate division KSB1 bacterium]NIT72668.1 NAD(P)-binding domain-containing protein [candidate division KSB1 bacterium]NIU26483.1 NAD(P)-binding domain-containing protein [candidate division KSB1 bacterium]
MGQKRLAIIGAGPVGLEAALYGAQLGYHVDVFEKSEVGANMRSWGHVTLFSPWKMNHSILGVSSLKKHFPEWQEPEQEAYLTGKQHVDAYLLPLSRLPQLAHSVHSNTDIQTIGRAQILKGDLIGSTDRTTYPFRILIADADGNEKMHTADIVIDASGVYGNPNWLGEGGIPALGENKWRHKIDYQLSDIYGADRKRFAGRKTLLVGSGYSAATAISDFQ